MDGRFQSACEYQWIKKYLVSIHKEMCERRRHRRCAQNFGYRDLKPSRLVTEARGLGSRRKGRPRILFSEFPYAPRIRQADQTIFVALLKNSMESINRGEFAD